MRELLERASTVFALVSKSPLGARRPSDSDVLQQLVLYEAQQAGLGAEDAYSPMFDKAVWRATHSALLYDWAYDGYGWLRTTNAFAAALMCTDPTAILPDDLELPWASFLIEMPMPALLVRGGVPLTHIFVDGWKFNSAREFSREIRVSAFCDDTWENGVGHVSASWAAL